MSRASLPVATSRPSSFAMRTICSICWTEVIFSPCRPQRVSSLPLRVCRPMAMAIVFSGSTLRISVSSVRQAPSGTRLMKFIML